MTGLRLTRRALAFLVLGAAASAHAGGIDCDNAKTKIERLICDDKSLSKLDSELTEAYQKTLEHAADQNVLIQSQREWLKQRDRCRAPSCLAQAYSERIAALKHVKRAKWKTYRDSELGISFEYLGNRQIKKPCPFRADERCVALIGHNMQYSDYIIAFEVVNGPLEKVAIDKAGFEPRDGKWVTTYGRGTSVEVEQFAGRGWKGMRATIACGVQDRKTGFHAVGGDCFWAVLSDGKHSVVADTQGVVGNDPDTERSVSSLQFGQ